jgi:hypothetical protein
MKSPLTITVTAEELAVLEAYRDAQYERECKILREAEDGYPRRRELFYRDYREEGFNDDDNGFFDTDFDDE